MGMDDTVRVLGQSLPLPVAAQCAALGTVLASLFVCAAAWAALQRQVCGTHAPLSTDLLASPLHSTLNMHTRQNIACKLGFILLAACVRCGF